MCSVIGVDKVKGVAVPGHYKGGAHEPLYHLECGPWMEWKQEIYGQVLHLLRMQ